jgi:hypothetical protein
VCDVSGQVTDVGSAMSACGKSFPPIRSPAWLRSVPLGLRTVVHWAVQSVAECQGFRPVKSGRYVLSHVNHAYEETQGSFETAF